MSVHLAEHFSAQFGGEGFGATPATCMTRRGFLATCLAGYARLALPAGETDATEQRWALISDTHISRSAGRVIRGSCMDDNLEHAIAAALTSRPHHVLFSGDMAFNSGQRDDYAQFQRKIRPLLGAAIPIHLALGNHDDRETMLSALAAGETQPIPGKAVFRVETGGAHWVILDSLNKVGGNSGLLGAAQLARLARLLDGTSNAPTFLCLHHHPEDVHGGLKDARAFLDIVRPRRHVKAIFFGHTHEYRVWTDEGLHFVNLPATGYRLSGKGRLGWTLARFDQGRTDLEFRSIDGKDTVWSRRALPWRTDAV